MRWLIRRMRLLRVRPVGGDHAQLPAAAADAGRSGRRDAAAAEPVADRVEPGDHPDLPRHARRRPRVAAARSTSPTCTRSSRSTSGSRRRTTRRTVSDGHRRGRCRTRSSSSASPSSSPSSSASPIGMVAAWRRGGAVDNIVVPTLLSLERVPGLLHLARRGLLLRPQARLVPARSTPTTPTSRPASTTRSSRARSATRSCRSSIIMLAFAGGWVLNMRTVMINTIERGLRRDGRRPRACATAAS